MAYTTFPELLYHLIFMPSSLLHLCNKLLFFRSLLHGAFSRHFTANIPFHKMRLLVPKLLKYKLPAIVQKMFARASILLHNMGNQPEIPFNQKAL